MGVAPILCVHAQNVFQDLKRLVKRQHQGTTHSSQLLWCFPGHGDIALYGPVYVTTACFHDGPARAADESPLAGQCRNCKWGLSWRQSALCFCFRMTTWKVTVLLFTRRAVHGSQHTYARSVHPSVCTHTDVRCSRGGEPSFASTHQKTNSHLGKICNGKKGKSCLFPLQENSASSQVDSSGNHSPYSYQPTK